MTMLAREKKRMFEITEKSHQKLVRLWFLCSLLEIGHWLAQGQEFVH